MKFKAILIDPPWSFDTYSHKGQVPARGKQPYRTLSLREIAGLPVPEFMADNCAVFLWKSDTLPHAASFLATAWGLTIPTDPVFVWVKPSIGMGYWSRKRSEQVVLLKKGRPKRISCGVDQVIEAPRREHSRKPDEIYSRIESLVSGPYLEIFARQQWPGWSAWGNETGKFPVEPQEKML
jgi:N6-adenosine-specific RNA methylase IME4